MELYEIKQTESTSVHQENEIDDNPRGWFGDYYEYTTKSRWVYLFGFIPVWRLSIEIERKFYCKEEEIGL